jgi:hypothetical protein
MRNEVNETIQFGRLQCCYYGWEYIMPSEMASDGMIYIPNLMKIDSDIQVN